MVQDLTPAEGGGEGMKEEILNLLKEEEASLDRQVYERYRDKAFQAASAL